MTAVLIGMLVGAVIGAALVGPWTVDLDLGWRWVVGFGAAFVGANAGTLVGGWWNARRFRG